MISLQNYTTYSIFSGAGQIEEWVAQAKKRNHPAIAITDKGAMDGHLELQKACKEEGIKPIFGIELLVCKDVKNKESEIDGYVLLYAKDEIGYKNMIQLNNISQRKPDHKHQTEDELRGIGGFYFRPRIDWALLEKFSEGLICVISGEDSIGWTSLREEGAIDFLVLKRLIKIFGEDLFIGLDIDEVEKDPSTKKMYKSLAGFSHIKKTLCFNSHWWDSESPEILDVVKKLGDSYGSIRPCLRRDYVSTFPSGEMEHYLERCVVEWGSVNEQICEEIESSFQYFMDKCEYIIPTGVSKMPDPGVSDEELPEEIFKIVRKNFQKKLIMSEEVEAVTEYDDLYKWKDGYPAEHINKGEDPNTLQKVSQYIDQLKYELDIVKQLGFMKYFYVIWDICNFVDEMGEGRGFARGSAAGSLLSYLLNITRVDPLRHGLMFERFLNPDRNDLPDIDLDFSSRARDLVKEYIVKKYGEEKVVAIGTHQRLKIASAIKRVAGAYGYTIPDNDGNLVPYEVTTLSGILSGHVTATARGRVELEERLESSPSFANFYELHSKWIDGIIMPLQETVTSRGIHAAGTLILPSNMDEHVPIWYHNQRGVHVTQCKDRYCEEMGYPKFDFLVVEGVDVASYTKHLVMKLRKITPMEIDGENPIALDDPDIMEIFYEADTEGIFQFNTYLQKNYMKVLKPTKFDHIVAAVAINRPGPIGIGAERDFVARLHGEQDVVYPHPSLEPVLEDTLGLPIFQEQIMKIAQIIGGMSGSDADHLRKAIGKKKLDLMLKWKDVFRDGAIANGHDEEFVDYLWEMFEDWSQYGFNKSHAVAYTLLSYYQAYLKSTYPTEYFCATLRFAANDNKKDNNIWNLRKWAEDKQGIEFVFPDISKFAPDFEPTGEKTIAWPLVAIKGVGQKAVEEICKDGRSSFESIEEMYKALPAKIVTKGVWFKLIQAGFFNSICMPWEACAEYLRLRNEDKRKDKIPYEMLHQNLYIWAQLRNSVYGMQIDSWKDVAPFHPNVMRLTNNAIQNIEDGQRVFIGGYVQDLQYRKDRYGRSYAVMTLTDYKEEFKVNAWSSFWSNVQLDIDDKRPQRGQIIELMGRKDSWSPKDSNKTYHSVCLDKPEDYLNIVWREEDFNINIEEGDEE